MVLISKILIFFVALLHVGFLILEMFLWTHPVGRKIFKTTPEQARQSAVLAANQGLYNGFLAAGLLAAIVFEQEIFYDRAFFFLGCVLIAALYGAYSVNRRILLVQGVPAFFALLFTVMSLWS